MVDTGHTYNSLFYEAGLSTIGLHTGISFTLNRPNHSQHTHTHMAGGYTESSIKNKFLLRMACM